MKVTVDTRHFRHNKYRTTTTYIELEGMSLVISWPDPGSTATSYTVAAYDEFEEPFED